MTHDESYPNLPPLVKFLVRIIMALIRFFILWPVRLIFYGSILVATLFVRKEINLYKLNTVVSLIINLFSKVV